MGIDNRDSAEKVENGYVQVEETEVYVAKPAPSKFAVKSPLLRECLAEFIGTAVMIMFGDGVVAQVVLSGGRNGDYTHITLCWGLAVFLGIHVSGGVSGAHFNPAVSTTLAVFGRLDWRKLPAYIVSQILGAFFGAFVVYVVYYQQFNAVDPDRMTTQGVFATYPNANISNGGAFLTEVVGTALLMGGIFAIGDQKNQPASKFTSPAAVGLLIVAIGMAFGMNSGYALNPARDFGPRLFTSIAGWGSRVFTLRDHYFWVPIVGPLVGGPLGGLFYTVFIEMHHPTE